MNKYLPKTTLFLIGSFVLIFVVDAFVLNGILLEVGQLSQSKVLMHNEWWRVLTASFLHLGLAHLLLNVVTFYFAGIFLEPIIGSARFCATYIICNMVTHVVFSFTWVFERSVGGSAGLYGLVGVLLIYYIKDKNLFAKHQKNIGVYWLAAYCGIGTSRGFDALIPHIIGFVCGVLLGLVFTTKMEAKQ